MYGGQLGYDFRHVALLFRELVLHLEGADGVDFVAKKVDAERQLTRVGKHVENASAHGELAGFIDVVHLLKSQVAQLLLQFHDVSRATRFESHHALIHQFPRHHGLGKCLGVGDDEGGG